MTKRNLWCKAFRKDGWACANQATHGRFCNRHNGRGSKLRMVVRALRHAGEWIAMVDPKLPMPGGGDTQTPLLAEIEDALREARSEKR